MTSTEGTSKVSEGLRTAFGVVLLIAWVLETILWVYSAIHYLGAGDPGPVIRGACALLLMILLAGMEGLEVCVIDRWRSLYPERPATDLAGWLAARQLFVALIVTTATLLAEPESAPELGSTAGSLFERRPRDLGGLADPNQQAAANPYDSKVALGGPTRPARRRSDPR